MKIFALFVATMISAVIPSFAESGQMGTFHTMETPCRLFDSRGGFGQIASSGLVVLDVRHSGWVYGFGPSLVANAIEPLPVVREGRSSTVRLEAAEAVRPSSEACTIPDDASAAVVVVAVINADYPGHIKPLWSNGYYSSLDVALVNYGPKMTAGNTSSWTVIPLCGDNWGDCDQDMGLYNAGVGAVDIVVDLYGWHE